MSLAAPGRSTIIATAMAPNATPAIISQAASVDEVMFDIPNLMPRRATTAPRQKRAAGRRFERDRKARIRRETILTCEAMPF